MVILGWVLAIAVAVVVIAIAVLFLNRFYRKSTRDIALVRTGFGGQRIVLSGGCLALPFLHKVEEINMRTLRIEVSRCRRQIADHRRPHARRRRARVLPARAADRRRRRHRGAGDRRQVAHARRRAQPARRPLHRRHPGDRPRASRWTRCTSGAPSSSRSIRESVRENLEQSGMLLESVSLTRLDQAAFAVARRQQRLQRRRPAQARRDHRRQPARSAPRSRPTPTFRCGRRSSRPSSSGSSCRARKKRRRSASASRSRSSRRRATPTRRARASSRRSPPRTRASSASRQTRVAEIAKQRELRKLEIEAQLNFEVKKVDSSIALAAKHAEEARAQAQAELARTEIVLAQEQLQTERERAVADRSREIALKREQERGEVETLEGARARPRCC